MTKKMFATPFEAEQAFYTAFETGDAEAMRQVWDEAPEIECVHPMGGRMRGAAVHDSWQEIFDKADPIAFHISDRQSFEQDDLSVHMVQENILFRDKNEQPLLLLATNVFRRGPSGWRMVLHHSSPAPHLPTVTQQARHNLH